MDIIEANLIAMMTLFGTYHLITGIVSMFFPRFSIRFYKGLYDFGEFKDNQQMILSFKPWGALAFSIGIMVMIFISDPVKYRLLTLPVLVLVLLRVWYRYTYREDISRLFGTKTHRNLINIAILAYCAASISVWILQTMQI